MQFPKEIIKGYFNMLIRLTQVNFKGHQKGSIVRVNTFEAKTLIKWNLAEDVPDPTTEKTTKKKKTPCPDKSGHPSTKGNGKTEK